jgi:hypothetical protein
MKVLFTLIVFFSFTYVFSQNILSLNNVQASLYDTVQVDIVITNSDSFVAFQTDIKIPDGINYLNNSSTLTDRANGHILSTNLLTGNILRILAFTLSQSPFTGDTGAVMNFKLITGDSLGVFPLELINPIISNANSQNILTSSINGSITVFDTVVSVELSTFYGIRKHDGIELIWSTASETNNLGFFIERQINSLPWEIIGFVDGKGNSTSRKNYSFFDEFICSMENNNLSYRIKQVDYNGDYKYYDSIFFIPLSIPNSFRLYQNYPNPFNPSTIIGFFLPVSKELILSIFDSGKKKRSFFSNKLNYEAQNSICFLSNSILKEKI